MALAVDRINRAIRSVNSQWTGLRTFAPDRELAVGEDPRAPGFFWLVGQGGTGIRASPAYGALLASQVTGADMPPTNWRRRGWTRRFSIRGVLAAERTGNPQHPVLVRMGVGRLVGRVQERVARPATEGCLLALN